MERQIRRSKKLPLSFDKTLTQQGEQRSPFAPNPAESKADAPSFAFGDIIG
jgi:hypothetical protein